MSVASASGLRATACIRRELLLSGLNKLEDRDTLKTAVQEINAIIHSLDGQGVTALVSCLCRVERHQKNYARKECLRLFGSLASANCPARGVFLSSSILSKTTRFLIQSFQDRDAGVRETAASTFAKIAKEWSLYHEQLIEGKTTNIFVKRLFKALSDSKKETQVAASDALSEMSPWLETLDKEAFKECLRYLKNPQFYAKANLINALASVESDSDEPRGVMKSCPETGRAFVFHFIGRQETPQHTGHGLLHLLFSPDWFTRKAAVDALRCIALLFRAELLNTQKKTVQQIKERLQRQRFDRVKLVRDAIHQTLELYTELSRSLLSDLNIDEGSESAHEVASLHTSVLNPGCQDAGEETEIDAVSVLSTSKLEADVRSVDDGAASDRANFLEPASASASPYPSGPANVIKRLANAAALVHPTPLKRSDKQNEVLVFTPPHKEGVSLDGTLTRLQRGQNQLDESVQSVQQRFDDLTTSLHDEIVQIKQSLEELQLRKRHEVLDNNMPALDWQEPLTTESPPAIGYDLDTLYSQALPCRLSLFRLMQRTAPVFAQLSEATREALLEIFIMQIEERSGLPRIFPWIWQLTQPSLHPIAASLPLSLREKLQTALRSLIPQDLDEHDQIEALSAELERLWPRNSMEETDLHSMHDFDAVSLLSASSRPIT